MNAVMQTLPEVTKEKHCLRRGIILSDFLKKEILLRINLIDIVRECLPGKKKGNYFYALCPFHSEHGPSLAIGDNRVKREYWQTYRCFGCGSHGDVIDFIMKFKGINYAEAIIYLSKKIPGLHVRYGNLYREDYFAQLEHYEHGGESDPRIPREVAIADTIDEYVRADTKRTFAYYKKCVDVILEAQSNRHTKFYGQKISEVLGYEPDVWREQNTSLQDLSQEDREAQAEVVFHASREAAELEEIESGEVQDEELGEGELEEMLSQEHEIGADERIMKESGLKELVRAKGENPVALLAELTQHIADQELFFQSKTYSTVLEGDIPMNIGDFGKCLVVFREESGEFSVIIGQSKAKLSPPRTLEDAEHMTQTGNIPYNAEMGSHESIHLPYGAQRLGGAQYIVLPNNTILIGGRSGEYGSVNQEVVRKCLENSGFTVHFLNNTHYQTRTDTYKFLCSE